MNEHGECTPNPTVPLSTMPPCHLCSEQWMLQGPTNGYTYPSTCALNTMCGSRRNGGCRSWAMSSIGNNYPIHVIQVPGVLQLVDPAVYGKLWD